MVEIAPLFAPIPGGPELLIILFIAILLFGANKIPKLARSTGEAMGEFQKGREKVETELEEMREGFDEDADFDGDDEFGDEDFGDTDDEFVDTEPVTSEDETEADTEPN
ncbi:twin-arginine translocase TatA/TatE family subunit [Natronococcus occultus]|uniref:Twin arginine-targeting protein translocase, TatA/E family n=1 Tax=Natronococcus occultus SP4 TaxID=694430 RepID=L0JXF7_9EURY|nr:twin-arginine translocase TatA/TatE family subunit [Natronococcus occultus]AGB36985.1 twin arginine-targeting protein translocase, TatA/E family [Natronococcus occultus SP4]